jgi:hypothetical protein
MLSRPILVLNMGKVASQSVWFSLRKQTRREVIHLHFLFDNHQKPKDREIFNRFVVEKEEVDVVTLVREPISRNISQFFQDLAKYTSFAAAGFDGNYNTLRDVFLKRFPHKQPLHWFDHNIELNFGINVFYERFPRAGFSIHSRDNVELLVLRAEERDYVKSSALRAFLHLDHFELERYNDAQDKDYAEIYKEFCDRTPLPADLVRELMESKYSKHFYSLDERQAIIQRWCAAGELTLTNGSNGLTDMRG